MIFLDDIEKLINEHGSSSILRERILFWKERFEALNSELEELKIKTKSLVSENDRLKQTKKTLEIKVSELQAQIDAPTIHAENLPKEQHDILILLMNKTMKEDEIIAATGRGAGSIRFDLEELKGAGLIESEVVCGFGPYCNLTQDGRRYLKKNGLLI